MHVIVCARNPAGQGSMGEEMRGLSQRETETEQERERDMMADCSERRQFEKATGNVRGRV